MSEVNGNMKMRQHRRVGGVGSIRFGGIFYLGGQGQGLVALAPWSVEC